MSRRFAGLDARRAAATAGICALAAWVGACSTVPAPAFHSLMPPPVASTPRISAVGVVAWEVLPVAVPAQVDQPQWVVQGVDGSLAVLEQQRWIAPLGAEIRAAVAERLTLALGAPAAMAAVEPGKQWRVGIEVQRFDSAPGRETRLEARWTLRSATGGAAALSCRGEFVQAMSGTSYLALAKGHQQGVAQLGDAIASAIGALSAGRPAACEG